MSVLARDRSPDGLAAAPGQTLYPGAQYPLPAGSRAWREGDDGLVLVNPATELPFATVDAADRAAADRAACIAVTGFPLAFVLPQRQSVLCVTPLLGLPSPGRDAPSLKAPCEMA